jgi:uracil-DNA glycosylase family 4
MTSSKPSLASLVSSLSPPVSSLSVTPERPPQIRVRSDGPLDAKMMLVTEAPSEKECANGHPLTSTAGWFVGEAMKEAGLDLATCFRTSVARESAPYPGPEEWIASTLKARSPSHKEINGAWVLGPLALGRQLLLEEVSLLKPTLVLAMGEAALWALTGKKGIRKWRGSILQGRHGDHEFKVIPCLAPDSIMREYSQRPAFIQDLRRAGKELARGPVVSAPNYAFIIRPNYGQAISCLEGLLTRLMEATAPVPLSADIETRAGHTACLGVAWSRTEAICIPFMCVERTSGYWSAEEELAIIILLRRILAHPNASVTWQNGAYDHQYEWRWHFYLPGMGWDTMLAHHSMFSISPKGLDYLSSIYCDYHVYWKDDGRLWDPSKPENEYWAYNCEDCVRTFEIREAEQATIQALTPQWPRLPEVVEFQHRIQPLFVKMMLRGVRSDETARKQVERELIAHCKKVEDEIAEVVGTPLNIDSPKQMTEYFYDTLNQTPIFKRLPGGARGNRTCDDEALLTIAGREPVLRPLVHRIQALRSGRKFLSTYVQMQRDVDGRLRCSYNVAGTKTYRLASAENAFGSGGNLQNIPTGDEAEDAIIPLPNIRKLFLFDERRVGFDLDGDSADLRIVTGESGCRQMMAYFAAGAKPYVEIAKEFYRDPTITKHHSSYKRMKALCHGSNYGGEPAGLSERIGLPVKDIERMQRWYFGMCPEIAAWQNDIRAQCEHRGYIENPFGYRLWRWDRYSRKILNEFLAWTPQSTVGLLINKIAVAIEEQLPSVELLLQVHDSLTGQYPDDQPHLRQALLDIASSIEIPCRTGKIRVPAGTKTSTKSWGDCE